MIGQKNIVGVFCKSPALRTADEEQLLTGFIEANWLRPLRKPLSTLEATRKLEYMEYADREVIITEGEKIEHYYFLLEGTVACEKHRDGADNHDQRQFVRQLVGPHSLGESLLSPGLVRNATYVAQGTVKCCRIEYQTLRCLCSGLLQDNQEFQSVLSTYMETSLQAISKLEIWRFLTYKEFNIRDRLIARGQRRISKNVIYFVLSGECLMSSQTVSKDSIGHYNSVLKYHEISLMHICPGDLVGVEILLEQQYRYNYTVTTEPICVLEICCGSIDEFPLEFKERLSKTYFAQQSIVQVLLETRTARTELQPQKPKTRPFGASSQCTMSEHQVSQKQANELRQLCMFIPIHRRKLSNDCEANLSIPYSGFIPKKKELEKPVVDMNRRLWSNYIKLPKLRSRPAKSKDNSLASLR